MAMMFGLLAFGRLGAAGGRVGASLLAAPAAPTLTLISGATDNTPDFTLTGDLVVGDTVRFQYSTSVVFSGASEITNTIDAGEDAANELDFSTGALADGTWYFRARTERPGHITSDWSNTQTINLRAGDELSRLSALNVAARFGLLPIPDGTVGVRDRKTVGGVYNYI